MGFGLEILKYIDLDPIKQWVLGRLRILISILAYHGGHEPIASAIRCCKKYDKEVCS